MKKILIYIFELLIIVIVVNLIFTFVIQSNVVIGSSMAPTIHENDRLLTNTFNINESKIERFDIVIINWEEGNEVIIKRVIGFGGDRIKFSGDKLYINGIEHEEYYLDYEYIETIKKKNNIDNYTSDFEVIVPVGQYFVLGDNRIASADSRTIGTFGIEDIIGVDAIVFYPLSNFGILE